ncbi:DUF2272 domain-containing protein [Ideonella sp. 4Y16]|uniref:DUF2272 domain-containing protein n=1 Tax=Ideonella alba TaxID=2824118 RepID=UPI001B379676|nr:DUF2272 domain-containing protein [Ideonella alba]MBQ0945530.1 DUF2272 domain-containing protein [Ideonella alba]
MGIKASIVAAARSEWDHWGQSVWDLVDQRLSIQHTDDESAYAQYVIDHYCAVGGGHPSLHDVMDDRYYWSAVGMSAIMKAAGLTKARFPFAQAHSVWIRQFIAARKAQDSSALFWGYRVGEAGGAPQVGDLVAYSRVPGSNPAKAAKLFDATTSYPSHSDVVVATGPGYVEVIGCNVRDSVTLKRLPVDDAGHLRDPVHPWFAVLKLRTD